MLSLFPQILFLAPVAATLLRLSLTFVLAMASWKHSMRSSWALRILGIVEIVLGGLLLVGAWAQAAALAAAIVATLWLVWREARIYPLSTVLLSLAIALSLTVLGAGAFAIDLPL